MFSGHFCNRLTRKKTIVASQLQETKLQRCLGIVDLVGLGLGASFGLGVYVMTSYAIKNEAGPAFVISVIVAGVAALFSGLCYAEFSARLPRAGAAYLFSYATLGELCGFVVGWNMILENIIGAAAAAKAWGQYLDFMLNGTVKSVLENKMKLPDNSVLCEYPDFLAFGILLLATIAIASGAKVASRINVVLVFFNILVILCFVCVGYFHVEHSNWTDPPGFFSHGFSGVLSGAAVLFYSFSNFEIIASAGEETKEPSKSVPSAIMLTAFLTAAMFFCIATSTTLSLHASELGPVVALPTLLESLNISGASTIVSIGGLLGLLSACISSLFYLPRILYSMASDGLISGLFASISYQTGISVYGTIICASSSALIALFVKLDILVQLISVGVLLSYTIVAVCIICIRYQNGVLGLYIEYEEPNDSENVECTNFNYIEFNTDHCQYQRNVTCPSEGNHIGSKDFHKHMYPVNGYTDCQKDNESFNDIRQYTDISKHQVTPTSKLMKPSNSTYKRFDSVISTTSSGSVTGIFRLSSDTLVEPSDASWRLATIGLIMYISSGLLFCVATIYGSYIVHVNSWWILGIVLIFAILLTSSAILIARQPQNRTRLFFRTPYVPFVPLVSILLNMYLIGSLPEVCWIRLVIWTSIGLIAYFLYGYRHSLERDFDEQEVVLYEITENDTDRVQKNGD